MVRTFLKAELSLLFSLKVEERLGPEEKKNKSKILRLSALAQNKHAANLTNHALCIQQSISFKNIHMAKTFKNAYVIRKA